MIATYDIQRLAERELLRREAEQSLDSLAAYVRYMWPVIEPGTPLSWNWHLDVIASELEAVTRGETRELVICVPPGAMKSIMVSVLWPTWEWLEKPWLRSLHISNSDRLCARDSRRARDIVQSDRYQMLIAAAHERRESPLWSLSRDQAEKVHFANTEGGIRLAVPSHARLTGDRGDKLVIDDPIDAQEAVVGTPEQVMRRMEEIQHRYDHVWASRLNDPERNPRVTIMQRLAPGDLAGVLIQRGVRHVVLPMEYDPDRAHEADPRTERGELLFPGRFGQSYIDKLKTTPGAARHYQSQYQQAPPPMGGGIFQRKWFRYYRDEGDHYIIGRGQRKHRIPKADCWRVIVGDTALSERRLADFSVLQVWDVVRRHTRKDHEGHEERFASEMFLVDQWRDQVTAPDLEDQIERMVAQHKPLFVALEQSTASMAIIQRFRRDGLMVKPLKPQEYGRDKVDRATPASIWMEGGKVFFPEDAEWLGDFEAELLSFPAVEHDDQCDTLAWSVQLAADRDAWVEPPKEELPPNAIGRILGHDKLLNQHNDEPDRAVFARDRDREDSRFNAF